MSRATDVFTAFVVFAKVLGVVLGCGSTAVLLGFPFSFTLGPLAISATNTWRLAAQAAMLLLIAEVLDLRLNRSRHTRVLVLLLCVFVSLSAIASLTRIGDSGEYIATALNLADMHPPALSPKDLDVQEGVLAHVAGYGGDLGLRMPALVGHDGRQDFYHFWFYSLLASPWVGLSRVAGLNPGIGFVVLNCGMLLVAASMLLRRYGTSLTVLFVVSPILWWVDKTHTEVFSYSLLTIAIVALREAPWWSLICLGMASTQNPPFVVAFVVAAVSAACSSLRADRRVWLAGAVGGLLCVLHPAYYLWHLGRTSPLAQTISPNMPSLAALMAPVWDLNLGILVHFPGIALSLVLFLWCVARDRGRRMPAGELAAAAAIAAVFLSSFTQTANTNSGGTPHPSRYGLWLIPLTIPILAWTWESLARRGLLWVVALVVAVSSAYSTYAYQPRWPEQYLNPTPFAAWIWTRWPAISNPLPEVFAERVSGVDGDNVLPVATSGCEKVLLIGNAQGDADWPLPCQPVPLPAACRDPEVLCYANRTSSGYTFTRAPRQTGFAHGPTPLWAWSRGGNTSGSAVFGRVGPVPLSIVRPDRPALSLLGRCEFSRTRRIYALRGEGILLGWYEPVDPAKGKICLVLPKPGTIAVIDPETNRELWSLTAAADQLVVVALPNIPVTALLARFR